jgi:hypothetical protein
MLDCLIAGDSIALGLQSRVPECTVDARVGASSAEIIGKVKDSIVLFVSAGSNDALDPHLEQNLMVMRVKTTGRVIWILPVNDRAAKIIMEVARKFKDDCIGFGGGPDKVHPTTKEYDNLGVIIREEIYRGQKNLERTI